MRRRLRVLVSAYACSPYKGSEPAVGWGFVSSLARHHDLWVIVEEEKCREDIEKYLLEYPDLSESVRFFFIRKKRNRMLRRIWPPSYYWYYRKWHQKAFSLAEQLHRDIKFDLAHQLTMVGFREPGYLWKLGIPFVWGPIGGMGFFPLRFLTRVGLYGAVYYLAYNMLNFLQMRLLVRPRLAARKAGQGLICATSENRDAAESHWKVRGTLLCEVGIPHPAADSPLVRESAAPLKIVWTGLHIQRKALNLGLSALARVSSDIKWELHILGDGTRTIAWQRLAQWLRIAEKCFFHTWLPRHEAMTIMKQAHVLLITSLRDLTSTVTIEALSLGMPVVCLDHCGFADAVTPGCGIKIRVLRPRQVIRDIANAIEALAKDESFRLKLAKGAIARSQDFSWERKVTKIAAVYEACLMQRNTYNENSANT